MNILTIDRVSKTFEQHKAVNNVSLDVPANSIFGLLGPNGAGKTTLIRMITNILYQDAGTITLHHIPKGAERNMYIGYMPEERGLYTKMNVGEQLMYLAQLKNLSKENAKQNILRWFDKLEIGDWWNKKVRELSKGMQQKIQFVATVMHDPKLIILDEPFTGLDPINTNLITREIFELKEKGVSIIFSTHRMEQVEAICECIALINKGQIILEGKVNHLKERFKAHKYEIVYSNTEEQLFTDTPVFDIVEQSPQRLVVHLKDTHSVNEVLQFLVDQNVEVKSFRELLPSLNEIFINQVHQTNTATIN